MVIDGGENPAEYEHQNGVSDHITQFFRLFLFFPALTRRGCATTFSSGDQPADGSEDMMRDQRGRADRLAKTVGR